MDGELIRLLLPYLPPSIAVFLLTVSILVARSDRRRAVGSDLNHLQGYGQIREDIEELDERVKDGFAEVRDDLREMREMLRYRGYGRSD